jgi:hypothetical protein
MDKRLRRIIAGCQTGGSVLALGALSYELTHTGFHPVSVSALIAVFLVGACAVGILGGLLLWRERRLGYQLSIVAQALQILLIVSSPISYSLIFGFGAWVYLEGSTGSWEVGVSFPFGERHEFRILGHRPRVTMGVNLAACCALYYLWRSPRLRSEPGGNEP